MRSLFYVLCLFGLVACASPPPPPPLLPSDRGTPTKTVYVTSNGWHTGLVIARGDLTTGRIPEAADFPGAAYLEFGWGDREYYPARNPGVGMALSAALAPGPSVMHVAGWSVAPHKQSRLIEVLALRVSAKGLSRLIAAIDASFDRRKGGRAKSIAPGLYRDSKFYSARGEFHLMNTCNTWTAHKLIHAGFDVTPGVIEADDLMAELREHKNVTVLQTPR